MKEKEIVTQSETRNGEQMLANQKYRGLSIFLNKLMERISDFSDFSNTSLYYSIDGKCD